MCACLRECVHAEKWECSMYGGWLTACKKRTGTWNAWHITAAATSCLCASWRRMLFRGNLERCEWVCPLHKKKNETNRDCVLRICYSRFDFVCFFSNQIWFSVRVHFDGLFLWHPRHQSRQYCSKPTFLVLQIHFLQSFSPAEKSECDAEVILAQKNM